MDETHRQNLLKSRAETEARRKLQVCKVFETKVDKSRLKNTTIEQIERAFLEAKWLYNYLVALNRDIDFRFDIDCQKLKEVKVLNKDKEWENREIKILKTHSKGEIKTRFKTNIKTLSALKKNGYEIGRVKFKSEVNSIPFSSGDAEVKTTNKIKLPGIKQWIPVKGLKRILDIEGIEIANAVLIRRCGDYYINLTTFQFKDRISKENNGQSIAIDFGVKNSFTLSDGRTFNYSFEETERMKRLQHKLFRQRKGSNNRRKTKEKLKKAYQKLTNKKKDVANKFVSMISRYNRVCIQDEQLSSWKVEGSRARLNSKRIQHSILGQVKSKLISLPQTVVLEKWIPTTKWCHVCGKKTKTQGSTFECSCCKEKEDRDVHAAKNMLFILENFIPAGRRDFKLVEFEASCRKTKFLTMKQEDHRSLACG